MSIYSEYFLENRGLRAGNDFSSLSAVVKAAEVSREEEFKHASSEVSHASRVRHYGEKSYLAPAAIYLLPSVGHVCGSGYTCRTGSSEIRSFRCANLVGLLSSAGSRRPTRRRRRREEPDWSQACLIKNLISVLVRSCFPSFFLFPAESIRLLEQK